MIQTGSKTLVRTARAGLPGYAYFLMVLGGPWPFLPFLSRSPSRLFRAAMILASLAPLPAVALLPFNWLFISMLLAGWNLLWSFAAMVALPLERAAPSGVPVYRRLRTSLALAVAALPLAVFLASMEQWLSDLLWSSYYPINASVDSISAELGVVWLNFGLLLFFSALQSSKEGGTWSLGGLLRLILLATGAHVFVNQTHLLLITIPLWQVEELTIFPPWLDRTRQILFFVMWFSSIPLLVHHCLNLWRSGKGFIGAYVSGLLAVGLAMLGLAVVTGLPINYALLMGQHYEKSGTPQKAIPWYSRALAWSRSDNLKSYLQFRVALLHRKSGNLEESKEAFIRVLVKYYHDSRLLLEAHEFRDRLEKAGMDRDSTLKRVVIPGIEARTEYKSAYCVPNSLGLVLNFWGDRSGAKRIGAEITQLDRGSLITDEAFFSESRGFANLVLPLRSMQDIFKLIDHGIPVLAFIPGHVIAVFGYDQVLQTLVTYDVNTYDIWDDQRWSAFSQDWSHMYNTLGIVISKSRLPELKGILGQDIDVQNEAYLQFLIARMTEEDIDRRALHLGRSAGHGFFFADWEYENLIGRRPLPAVKDSAIAGFLIGHDVYESQILEYLQSLYQRGDYARAIAFIERYRKENRLSSGMATLLAGCYNQMGDSVKAGEVLLGYIDLDEQEAVTLEFLLGQDYVQEDPETARRIALKLLESEDKLPGSAADLAFWTWRKHTVVDFRNIDEALAVMEGYLTKWNPYDRRAISELLEAFKLKTFRADDEFNQRGWEKKIRIYRNRLAAGV
jgi:tetratricopeptide (TPR) repeat protein